mgnify:CR=1 FL=1
MNLYSRRPKHTFIGRHTRNEYESFSALGLGPSTGSSTEYNASLLLREPAYPVVSVQFIRNLTSSEYAGTRSGYGSTTWMTSAYYDLAPFRFTFDRTRQQFDYSTSSSSSVNQRSAAMLNYSLIPGLTLSSEISRYNTKTEYASGSSSIAANRRNIRLTAIPTRAIVADLDLSTQTNEQTFGTGRTHSENKSMS